MDTSLAVAPALSQIALGSRASIATDSDTGLDQQFTDAELRAIVEVAHLMRRRTFRVGDSLVARGHGVNDASGTICVSERLPFEKPFEQVQLKR